MSTEVTIQDNNTRPLYRKIVRDGVAGNYEIVWEMIRLIRDGVDYDLSLQHLAASILAAKGYDSYTPPHEQLEAIFDFVAAHVTYIQDIAGRIESLKDARQTLSDKYGDCDDQTVLNASLAGCLGFEDVRIAMAKYRPDATSFAHVYCVVYVPEAGKRIQRYVLDTSLPKAQFNQEIKAADVREINVFNEVSGFDGLSGIYNQVRYNARKAARFAVRIIPGAVNVLPLGFVAGSAIATGADLIDKSSSGDSLSVPAVASEINKQLDKIIADLMRSRIAYDLAKSEALRLAANLGVVNPNGEEYAFTVARASIKEKLDFINNFELYARDHSIKVVYLDSTKMLCAGLLLAGGAAYALYKNYQNKRLF